MQAPVRDASNSTGSSMNNSAFKRSCFYVFTVLSGILLLAWIGGSVVEANKLVQSDPSNVFAVQLFQTSFFYLIFLIPALVFLWATYEAIFLVGSNPREFYKAKLILVTVSAVVAGVILVCVFAIAFIIWVGMVMLTGDTLWFWNGLP